MPHAHLSAKNIFSAVLTAVAAVPSFACAAYLYTTCSVSRPVGDACELAIKWPILFANVLFFANVTVGFWLIGLAQRSFWLIDPYWTLLAAAARATPVPAPPARLVRAGALGDRARPLVGVVRATDALLLSP